MRPEQQRALDYLERKGTQASAADVRGQMEKAFTRLEARLESLAGHPTHDRPSEHVWSLVEIVDHLVESHRPAVVQLRAALRGEDPGPPIPAGLVSDAARSVGWSETVAALQAVHRSFLDALSEAADPSAIGGPSSSKIPVVMVVRAEASDGTPEVLEWVEELHWKAFAVAFRVHTLEHLAQLDRVADAVSDPSHEL